MSHDATNWAIKQKGLKPATKIVLWHLADRHNPDYGCFPRQDTLAADAEVSRASLNNHLAILEAKGLIRRVARIDPKTKRQMSTRYILACEPDFAQYDAEPCPDFGHGTDTEQVGDPCPDFGRGAVSKKTPEPCPKNAESRVQILDTNPVREPLREPVTPPPPRAPAREVVPGLIERLTVALGFDHRGIWPTYWADPSAPLIASRWKTDLRLTDDEIVSVAVQSMRQHGSPANGPKALDAAMARYAGARDAPPLTPIHSPSRPTGHGITINPEDFV